MKRAVVSVDQLQAARELIIDRLTVIARTSDEPWLEDDDEASWHARVFWKNLGKAL